MPFDFTVAFQNGESYLLHMKDGSWVLADRETGRFLTSRTNFCGSACFVR